MSSAKAPVLAVMALTSNPEDFPLGSAFSDLGTHYRIRVLALRPAEGEDAIPNALRLEDLGLAAPSLRFALTDGDLASLVKPYFLSKLLEETEHEITLIDGNCILEGNAPLFSKSMDRFDLEVLPILPLDLASAKVGLTAAIGAGLGKPTGSVLRVRASAGTRSLVEEWRRWMNHVYTTEPTHSLTEAESKWLRALPGTYEFVGWSHEPVVAHWSDLQPGKTAAKLIDTTGFVDYQRTTGPAYSLMERRTHSGTVIDEIAARLQRPQVDQSIRFRSGPRVEPLARQILRATDPLGRRWADPANDTDDGSFRDWLLQVDTRRLPRFAQALYWARADLQRSFPARKTPVVDFVHWLDINAVGIDDAPNHVSTSMGIASKVFRVMNKRLGRGSVTLAGPRNVAGPLSGVNLVGFATAETGLGEAMRGTLDAVRPSVSKMAVLDVSSRIYARQLGMDARDQQIGTPGDVTIFHLNPTELIDYANDVLAYRMTAARHIGFFFWETEQVPEAWYPGCDMVDEIWVASTYLKRAFERVTDKPIHVMGMPVGLPSPVEPDRRRFGIDADDFVVSYVTDAYSGLERKDPLRAIRAFRLAFGPDYAGVHLLLKISNLEKFPELRRRLGDEVQGLPVTIVAEYLGRNELWSLLACSDAYLSLHASEGFGLTILEAMALGVPPIVTAYGGNMDFTWSDNSLLVAYEMTPAKGGPGNIYDGNGLWADPNLEDAARHLRTLYSDKVLRQDLGERARLTASTFTTAAYAIRIADQLRRMGGHNHQSARSAESLT